jgi:surface polysaccharide O-acyltransferase-like enzyme
MKFTLALCHILLKFNFENHEQSTTKLKIYNVFRYFCKVCVTQKKNLLNSRQLC